ncbi:hypothetical protein KIF59_05370 [Enterobacter cloacae subsp. cloacae]|nr:hypothetical protein [Enterobacter cloacae subsp. cloacae]
MREALQRVDGRWRQAIAHRLTAGKQASPADPDWGNRHAYQQSSAVYHPAPKLHFPWGSAGCCAGRRKQGEALNALTIQIKGQTGNDGDR